MLSSGKSSSHSNGVNSTRADQFDVDIFTFAQGCGFTLWGSQQEESIMVGDLHITAQILDLIQGHTICDLAYYRIFYFAPMIFHHPFPLKCISLLQNHVSQHQLSCAHRFIIVVLLSVHFTLGLVLGLSISLFEVLLHLYHISGDMMATCICIIHGEEKVYREVRSPPKHEIVG